MNTEALQLKQDLERLAAFYLSNHQKTNKILLSQKQWRVVRKWLDEAKENKAVPIDVVWGMPVYRGFTLTRQTDGED